MTRKQFVMQFWKDVAAQDELKLRTYFLPDATIHWHNTNESFSVEEYIVANCEYPGEWFGQVERIEVVSDDVAISVAKVWPANAGTSL